MSIWWFRFPKFNKPESQFNRFLLFPTNFFRRSPKYSRISSSHGTASLSPPLYSIYKFSFIFITYIYVPMYPKCPRTDLFECLVRYRHIYADFLIYLCLPRTTSSPLLLSNQFLRPPTTYLPNPVNKTKRKEKNY